jgi:hypothetical protein
VRRSVDVMKRQEEKQELLVVLSYVLCAPCFGVA